MIGNIIKSWKPHIDFVSKKISKSVGIIAKARFYLSSQTLMTLYYSHVYPFLTYRNVAWSSTYRSSVNCIYLLPKRLVRLITKPHYLAKTTPLFSRLKVLVKDWNDLPVTWAGNLIANFWKKSNPHDKWVWISKLVNCLFYRSFKRQRNWSVRWGPLASLD